ncbi:MAG: MFS transporter [Reyranella sp.]|uniref:MFS transporter n=1 Tax=Reyranella sp. TaxID=1929291 RepID=UPI001AC9378D|nr:MFS transporter [Reyranella sp.]MBN9089650.1 MFS transporter [Reyranella sp.]
MKIAYGWVVVGAGMLISCMAMGSCLSLGVFLQPMAEDTGWSRTGVSSAGTLVFLAMGASAFGWGWLNDRWGTRPVVLSGVVLLGIGLIAASRATTLAQFELVFGLLVGVAGGSVYAPLMTIASAWFDRQRNLAVSLVSAGMGMSPLVVAPFVRWLISAYDWRTAMLVQGIVAIVLLLPVAMLIRKPPPVIPPQGMPDHPLRTVPAEPPMTAAQAFRTSAFVALALTHFACCAAHSGPIFHMVTYAMVCGIAPMAAVSVYSVAGLSGLGGRLLLGIASDKLGAKPVLVAGLALQAAAAGTYYFVSQLGEFYALAVVFALAYGGVMPLYATLVREYFGIRIMGTVFGAVSAAASFGMAFGPVAGGWVFDTFNGYGWLYIGSFGIGLGAMAIALTFKPVARPQPLSMQPA